MTLGRHELLTRTGLALATGAIASSRSVIGAVAQDKPAALQPVEQLVSNPTSLTPMMRVEPATPWFWDTNTSTRRRVETISSGDLHQHHAPDDAGVRPSAQSALSAPTSNTDAGNRLRGRVAAGPLATLRTVAAVVLS
jgi:hypothetical protein